MCFYGRGVQGKQIHVASQDSPEPTITVDRTSWLDLSLGRFIAKIIEIPYDVDFEYTEHLKALVRTTRADDEGNLIGTYLKEQNDDDHYAHARNYAEIALPLVANMNSSQIITKGPI